MKIYAPMLAQDSTEITVTDGKVDINSKYFGNKDWIMEIKFDGARYILQWDEEGKAHLTSRHISVKDNLPTDKTENLRGYLFEDCPAMAGTVLDGEIIVMEKCGTKKDGSPLWKMHGDNGSAETNRIMLSAPDKAKERLKNPDIKLIYVVYDILSYRKPIYDVTTDSKGLPVGKGKIKGYEITDVTSEWLMTRKGYLEDAMIALDNDLTMREFARKKMLLSMNFKNQTAAEGKQQFEVLVKDGHEGVMLKHLKSPYVQGDHSAHWQKVKKMLTADGIALGLQRGTGKYKDTMGALIVGQFFEVEKGCKEYHAVMGYVDVSMPFVDKPGFPDVREKALFEWEWNIYFYKMSPENGLQLYKLQEVCTISGMTDEARFAYWDEFKKLLGTDVMEKEGNLLFTPKRIVADPFILEFIAQEKTKAKYRHPRFLQKREDKNAWDCLF